MIETVAPVVDITWPSYTNTMGDGSIDAKEKNSIDRLRGARSLSLYLLDPQLKPL